MPPRSLAVFLVLASALLAGCAAPAAEVPAQGIVLPEPRPTVVAVVDTGVDPAHEAFARPVLPQVERHLRMLDDVTLVARDAVFAAAREGSPPSLEPRRLYAFEGTNLLGISFTGPAEGAPVFDASGHGTRTASLVARDAPHALIVAIQVDPGFCEPGAECLSDPSAAEGLAWAAAQPWIDVVSVSMSMPANAPDDPALHPEVKAWLDASRAAHASGKIVVNSAGNDPSLTTIDYFNGPPWVVCVGAFEARPRGSVALMAYGLDVVANFTETVAIVGSGDGWGPASGTSYGTPLVAAALAEAVYEIRQRTGHAGGIVDGALARPAGGAPVTNGLLRDALNATARHVAPTDWDPTRPPQEDPVSNVAYQTVPVVAPEAQMGWGYVDGSLVSEIVRRVLEQDLAPEGKERAALVQARMQAAREARWS